MINIDNVTYFTVRDVIERLSVTRQTLWRWQREQKIPPGRRFREKQLLFTQLEFQEIEAFANRIEPEPGNGSQLSFFGTQGRR